MAQAATEDAIAPVAVVPLTEEEKNENWMKFEAIIYSNLEKILQKRPAYPVTKFAKQILEDVDLDENGEPIVKKKKKKDKKDKKDKDKKKKKDKDKKKDWEHQNLMMACVQHYLFLALIYLTYAHIL